MNRFADKLSFFAITLWVGGLWAIGFLAAPVLFASLGDKMLAGMLAGKMFSWIDYIGMACGSFLLIHRLAAFGVGVLKQGFFWAALLMLLLAAASHFGIQPVLESLKAQALPKDVMESMFRDRFTRWHGISSIVYLFESLLGLVLVLAPRRG
ncbi:MAG: DUF4149 domain-containing protein [Betaproteobacteria bacterium]